MTCTGSFIGTSDAPDAPAYVLTNGHCAIDPFGRESANLITVDGTDKYTIDFNYFHDSQDRIVSVDLESVAYATMKGTDIAILKTDQTIAQMRNKGLQPFKLSEKAPMPGAGILISGVPIKVDALQNSRCTNGHQVDVVENYWHWYGLLNNTCQGISSGSSGSPVFDTRKSIIGIINTTSEGAVGETCYNGNPCEVHVGGPRILPNHNYVVPTLGLSACFGRDGHFNLAEAGCNLPKPSGIEVQDYPGIFAGKNNDGQNKWRFGIQTSLDKVRVKHFKLERASDSCQNLIGYGQPIDANSFHPGEQMLPVDEEGVHQYCIIAANDETARHPEVVQVLVDNTAPAMRPEINTFELGEMMSVKPSFRAPEYSDYVVGFSLDPSLECAEGDYRSYRRGPVNVPLTSAKVCVYGYDLAGNRSEVFEYLPPWP